MSAGSRFYARVHSFDVACPACGKLLLCGRGRHDADAYSPATARLYCPSCKRPFIVGLVCWPVRPGARSGGHTRPADALPGPRERLEYRNLAGGYWPTENQPRRRPTGTNLTGEDCLCLEGQPPDPSCELHGE